MNPLTSWAIYARKSSESEEKQVQSIDDQLSHFQQLAKHEGLNITETIFESKSAKAPDARVGFQRLVKIIESGKVQGILCWKLDRLSRNPIDSARIQWLLQTGKIKCIRTSDRNYWPEDNALLMAVEQGMANQFIRDLSKNVQRGLLSKVEKGWFPAMPMIGYLNSKTSEKGKQIIIDDKKRLALIRKMFDLILTGTYSPMQIHRIATEEWKLDSPSRRKYGKKPIAISYIYLIFRSIFYTGHFYFKGKLYKGNHTPIITMEEFDKVQAILQKKGHARTVSHDFPFTGIMKCENCGCSITATEKRKVIKATGEIKTYTYYHCTRRTGIDECKEPPITSSDLINQIQVTINRYKIDSEFYELGLEILKDYEATKAIHHENAVAQKTNHVAELKRKIERLMGYLLNETITEEEYVKQKQDLESTLLIEEAKQNQQDIRLKTYSNEIKNTFHFCLAMSYALKTGTTLTRRELLSHFGSNQRLKQKNLCITAFNWFSAIRNGQEAFTSLKLEFELEKANNNNVKELNTNFSLSGGDLLEIDRTSNLAYRDIVIKTIENVREALAKSPTLPYIPDFSKFVIAQQTELSQLSELPTNSKENHDL